MSTSEITLRLLLAAFFGGMIGVERERKEWAAGLRTHMMVCVGSCLVMIVSIYGFDTVLKEGIVRLDPSRVAAGVVSGIGFIGAGTILFSKSGVVKGLTTAAGLWTVGAIGLATGGGLYYAAGLTTLIAFTILWALRPIEGVILRRQRRKRGKVNTLRVTTSVDLDHIELLGRISQGAIIDAESITIDKKGEKVCYKFSFEVLDPNRVDTIIEILKNESSVEAFSWKNE